MEGAAPVALVNMIGGFFNSVVLIVFLLFFNWQLGLAAIAGVAGLFTGDGSSIQKICFCRRKKAERPTGIGRGCFGVHSRDGRGKSPLDLKRTALDQFLLQSGRAIKAI